MCQEHDHHHEDEIDIVDLLGVVIKRRKFITWFVVCFTVLTFMVVLLKEYRNSAVYLEHGLAAGSILTTQNDAVLASYIFLNRSYKQDGYKSFLQSLLFPEVADAPSFETQRLKGLGANYLFLSTEGAKIFLDKYNAFIDEVINLDSYHKSMSEDIRANCTRFKNTPINSASELKLFLSNSKDATNCNLFYSYFELIQSRLKYTSNSVDDYYFPFIYATIKDSKVSKLRTVDPSSSTDIKVKMSQIFNFKKVIKYSIMLFILSIIIALASAFVFEFWNKNKTRISGYWR